MYREEPFFATSLPPWPSTASQLGPGTSGAMCIEQFIYSRDRYRCCSSAFPLPLPMRAHTLPNSPKLSEGGRQRILKVLSEEGVEGVLGVGVEGRERGGDLNGGLNVLLFWVVKGGGYGWMGRGSKTGNRERYGIGWFHGGDKVVPTLQIEVDAAQEDSLEKWPAAQQRISRILKKNGYSDLEVEIQDWRRLYQPSFFAIRPAHAAVRVYKAARKEMLAQIFDTIGSVWEMLSLFEVGRTANVKKPTVVLMVEPLATYDWKMLTASLEAILDRHKGDLPKLSVEIMPGAAHPKPPQSADKEQEQDMPGVSFVHSFRKHPRHGTSIGVQGEKGCGTLGGFFKMVSPSKTHTGFLTSSHTVAPPANAPFSERFQYDTMGLPYRGSGGQGTKVQYFAEDDVQASINGTLESIQATNNLIQKHKTERVEESERGQSTEESQSHLHKFILGHEQRMITLEEDLATAMDMPRSYGRTILASGRALTSKLATLDYAFVETSAIGDYGLPEHLFDYAKAAPSDLGLAGSLALSSQSWRFSSIKPGKWYFKIGRTTLLTSGICNGVKAWVNAGNQHTLLGANGAVEEVRRAGKILETDQEGRLVYDDEGKPKEMPGDSGYCYSSEWVIINASIDSRSFKTQQEFCAPGDSGSLIIDQNGDVAGLLWGELTSFCGPTDFQRRYARAGLVTSIVDVNEAMKLALGWPANANVDVLQFP
ncbi:MAG: hypothetical protein Q9195_000604 [Heterodermia aff. obscurata]